MRKWSLPVILLLIPYLIGCDTGDVQSVSFDGEWDVVEARQGDSVWTDFGQNRVSVRLRISDGSTKYEVTAIKFFSSEAVSPFAGRRDGTESRGRVVTAIDDSIALQMSGRLDTFIQPSMLAFHDVVEGGPFPVFWAQLSTDTLRLLVRQGDLGRLDSEWGISPSDELHIKLAADVLH